MRLLRLFSFLLVVCLACVQTVLAQADERIIYASVVDKNGAPALDLTDKDFIVREDGQAREILRVAPDNDPLQIALLIDTSEAIRNNVVDFRRAATAFVDNTRVGIQVAVIAIGARPTVIVGYTADHQALKKGINGLFSDTESGNYLLDGIAETSQGLEKRTMWRSVIVALTTPNDISYRQYDEVLRFFREGGASLHVLTLGMESGGFDRETVVSRGTDETGGRNEIVLSAMGLTPKAIQLATEISHQYRITFARPQRLIPPKNTDVSVKRPELRARGMLLKTEKER